VADTTGTPKVVISFSVKAIPTVASVVNDAGTSSSWTGSEATGASAYDTATITGEIGVIPTGTVSYSLFDNASCSGSASATQSVTVTSTGAVPDSTASGALATDSYSYLASYSGDENYDPESGSCEHFSVAQATPAVASTVDDAATATNWSGNESRGAAAFDSSTVTGVSGFTPSGTVQYSFFANGTCAGSPATTATVTLNRAGAVPSSADTDALSAGLYSFQPSYSGDSNYGATTGSCEPFSLGRTVSFGSAGQHTYTVPADVTAIGVTAVGGRGGDNYPGSGGDGATVSGQLSVTPGEQLTVIVGAPGASPGNPSFVTNIGGSGGAVGGGNGGSLPNNSSTGGGGGGGASVVELASSSTMLVVAGGGGGSAPYDNGGNAGATGSGGGGSLPDGGGGGGGGGATAGGPGGSGSTVSPCYAQGVSGAAGSLGAGGNGGNAYEGGGGGGGGYYGGGGGGGAGCAGFGGGGGGGSSFIAQGTLDAAATGAGPSVSITYAGVLPTATTAAASSVKPTTATANASVNPQGFDTTYYFQYGPTTAYGAQAPASPADTGSDTSDHTVSQVLSGLAPNTSYHFRVVATDAAGTTYGADQSFTTQLEPTTTALTSDHADGSAYGDSVSFVATVTGSDLANPSGGGNVDFEQYVSGAWAELCPGVALTGNSATCSTALFGAGSHPVRAIYSGTGTFIGSTSATLTQSVGQAMVHVDANSVQETYGAGDPAPSGALRASDFRNGDTATTGGINGTPSCAIAGHGADVGTYTAVVTCAAGTLSSANYRFVPGDAASLTINQASQSLSVTSAPPTGALYGGSYAVQANAGASGYPAIVSVDPLSPLGVCSVSGSSVSFTGVGTCTIDVNEPGDLDYSAATQVTQSITIGPATIHVDANPASDTYGQPDPTASATLRASDFQLGDTASTASIVGSPDCQIASHPVDAGTSSGGIRCDVGSLSSADYAFVPGTAAALTINPAVLHVDANPASDAYGQPDPSPSATLRSADFQYSDDASVVSGKPSCQIASHSQNAGRYSGAITCQPGAMSASNYVLVPGVAADLTINPAVVHVDANPASVTYGQSDPAPSATLRASDFQYSDTASVASGQASCQIASHSRDADTYSGAITCQPGSLSSSNYTFVPGSAADLTINPAVVHVDANAASKTYGDPDPAGLGSLRVSDLEYSDTPSVVSGQASCQIGSHSQDAGTYSGVVTCQPGSLSASNYTFASGSAADLTINPAVVHVDATPASDTYGQPDPTPSATLRQTDLRYSDTASAASGQASCQIGSHSQDAGTYSGVVTCQPGSLSASNYTLVPGSAADLTINPAVVHVDAQAASVTYGQSDPAPSATLRASDFQYSDTASVASGQASCQIASHSRDADTYSGAITCQPGSLSASNYTFVPGSAAGLTINQAVMHVDAAPASKTYGQSDPAPTEQLRASDFQYSDGASVVSGQASCQISSHSQDAGTYSRVITCAPGSLGGSNYTFVPGKAGDLTITKAPLTVTADNQTTLFGAAIPALTATISGFVSGQTSATSGVSGSPACVTTAISTSPGGTYPITCTAGSLAAANYSFAKFVPGTLTVNFSKTVTGTSSGQLTVGSGQAVLLGAGATVSGPLTIDSGGSLEADGTTITGPLKATGAAQIRLCKATISGPLTISGTTGPVVIGDDDGPAPCAGANITGPVKITDNTDGVEFDHNTVNGPLTITGNTGSLLSPDSGTVDITGNTVSGKQTVQN
jgi:hypothetical protein